MIRDNLDNEIYTLYEQTGKEVSLIVMHPQTWIDLTKEVFENISLAINPYNPFPPLEYRGIRVLRSFDMEEGEFEVRQ